MEEIYQDLIKFLPKENILKQEPMQKHTSIKIGGKADIFIIVNESNGVETIGYILLVLMILTFTEIILRKITMQTKVKNESFLDCRIVLTIISTLLLIYVSFSWILSNMKIKEVLLKIRASV